MSNDMRIVKFKMIIRDIWEDTGKRSLTNCLGQINGGWYTALLAIIYDYDKLNAYGKIIMEQVCELDRSEFGDDGFSHRVEFVEKCKAVEYRMKAAKALVKDLNEGDYKEYNKLLFIFWSLMILAVDDADKEEHLSLVCDFAKMLKVGDEEIMDIVQIIRAVFHEENTGIQTRGVQLCFSEVIKRYRIEVPEALLGSVFSSILGRYV